MWRFFAVTLGPKSFVAQSFGTDVGGTVKEQYQEWKQINDVDIKDAISHRKSFNFEKRCLENKRKPEDVRRAYRNVATIQGFLWLGVSLSAAVAVAGTESLLSGFLNALALIALPLMILATAHHQICIREKVFLSPGELFKFVLNKPGCLIPSPLPEGWHLYTKPPETPNNSEDREKRKITIKKRG